MSKQLKVVGLDGEKWMFRASDGWKWEIHNERAAYVSRTIGDDYEMFFLNEADVEKLYEE